MSTQAHISTKKKRWTLALGLLAAAIVACTSIFQFSLVQVSSQGDSPEVIQAMIDIDSVHGIPQKADSDNGSQAICKIQAVSQGVQLHVSYTPIVWESLEVNVPEFKLEIPTKLYKASWEYFRVLFTDIIAPNAP